tara:strand:+ start:2308 stop:2952 length:645 start_codon:yes stop_codon:yes gene_type:complete
MKRRDTIALIYLLKMASHLKSFTFWYYISKISSTEKFLLEHYHAKDLVQEFSINRTPSHRKKIYDNIIIIKDFLKTQTSRTCDLEWEFPKGRSMESETNLQTAKRELIEETALQLPFIHNNVYSTITETYTGLNRLPYRNVFYVMNYTKPTPIKKAFVNNIRGCSVSHESSDIKWISIEELRLLKCKKKYKETLLSLSECILTDKLCQSAINIS